MTSGQNTVDKHSVLVCDDDRDILRIVSKCLQNEGYNVHSFSDPIEALKDMKDGGIHYKFLITDVRMPRMNGFQLVKRAREHMPNLRAIIMTAFDDTRPEFETVSPPTKVDAVLTKPFSLSDLMGTINSIR